MYCDLFQILYNNFADSDDKMLDRNITRKSVALLTFFLGYLGFTDFYVKDYKKGLIKFLLFISCFGAFISIIWNYPFCLASNRQKVILYHPKGEFIMKKVIALIVSVLLLAALLAACTPVGSETPPTSTEAPTDVSTEAPTEPSQESTQEEVPYFTFTRENFPRMDGSTSMVPMGEAIASVLLGESRDEVADLVQFNRTTQSFRNLMWGYCDILIVGEPNAAV